MSPPCALASIYFSAFHADSGIPCRGARADLPQALAHRHTDFAEWAGTSTSRAPSLWPTGTCTVGLRLDLSQAIVHRLCRGDRDLHIPVQPPAPPAFLPWGPGFVRASAEGPPALSAVGRPGLRALAPRVSPSIQPQRHLAFTSSGGGGATGRPARPEGRSSGPVSPGPDAGHKFLGRVHACYNCCFIIRMIQHNNCTRAGRVH